MILFCVDVATIVLLIMLALGAITLRFERRETWIIALLCVGAIAHVALARDEYGPWMEEAYRFSLGGAADYVNVVRNTVPGLFALLTYFVFSDRPTQPRWLYGLIGLQVILESVSPERSFGRVASSWLQIAFGAIAIYWTIVFWRADLIEARRRARAVVSIILGINVVASTILLRMIIPEDSEANFQTHNVLSVFTLVVVAVLLLRLMKGELGIALPEKPKRSGPSPDEIRKAEDELAFRRLNLLLSEQRIHREPGLSLDSLAQRVGVPTYRMRRLIHEQLGCRNFNAFLHRYRIRDAVEQLADPSLKGTTILEIAHSVGYESVNTFNRGFREVMGVTPSQYRKHPFAPNSSIHHGIRESGMT